jgi:hypothetical protein
VSDNVHELKTWPRFYAGIADGSKTAEVRSTRDRYFDVGDVLVLREWDPDTQLYTGRSVRRIITRIELLGELDAAMNGYALLSFRRPLEDATRILSRGDRRRATA